MFEVEAALIIEGANALLGDSCPWRLELVGTAGGRVSGVGLYHANAEGADGISAEGAPRLLVADSIPTQAAAPVCVPPRECSIVRAYDLLQTAFDTCRTWYEDCLRLICNGAEIDAVLDAATKDLANPVACLDETGALVCRSGAFANNTAGTLWEPILANGYADPRFLTEAEQMRVSHSIAAHDEVIEDSSESDPDHRYVIVPLFDGGDFRGSLVSVDINAPFTSGQKGLMRLAGQLVLLVGVRKSREDAVQGTSYYARRLLEGEAKAQPSIIEHHFARRGWAADDSYLLFRFEATDFAPEGGLITLYERQIREALPNAMWARYEGGLVALGRKRDFDATNARMRERLAKRLAETRAICGISSCAIGFMDIENLHTQCLLALRAQEAQGGGRIGYFDELYPLIVRQELGRVSSMRSLCHPAVLRLAEAERASGGTRLSTLKTFLLNGRNVASSSRALGIHRNTMLYRLEKLQEDIGEDLDDIDESMLTYLLVSCLIATSESLEYPSVDSGRSQLTAAFIR